MANSLLKQVFVNFCTYLEINLCFYTPYRPQANEQAESSNKILINIFKKLLEKFKRNWIDELSGVLWAMRTTPKFATSETPFSLVYCFEAIIPTKILQPILKSGAN